MTKGKTEVVIIDVTKLQSYKESPDRQNPDFDYQPKRDYEILEKTINEKLWYLENNMTNSLGTKFTAEIISVQIIDRSTAIITMRTKQL